MKNTKSGFTLLEVILVVAISTLLFMSVVMGIGGRIATGRYETASTEITDYLRDVFTIALNTENAREGIEGARQYCTLYSSIIDNNGEEPKKLFTNSDIKLDIDPSDVQPGRTRCAIYGKALYFGADDQIHVFDVVGNVITNTIFEKNGKETTELKEIEGKDVLGQLEYVRADILAAVPKTDKLDNLDQNCRLAPAGSHTTYSPNWGALIKTANFGGESNKREGDDFVGMVMIVRAPASGNVHTFFYEQPGSIDKNTDYWPFIKELGENNSGDSCGPFQENEPIYTSFIKSYSPVELMIAKNKDLDDNPETSEFKEQENTGFCIGSDDFYVAISNLKKYVEFIPGGQNASAIKLNESSDKEENPCYGRRD